MAYLVHSLFIASLFLPQLSATRVNVRRKAGSSGSSHERQVQALVAKSLTDRNRMFNATDSPIRDFLLPTAEQTGMGSAAVYLKSTTAIASLAIAGTLTISTAGIAIGTAALTTYTGILIGKGISALVGTGVSAYYKRKAANLKKKQLAIFGNWETCNACLKECIKDIAHCAVDLFHNFMGLTLIKMMALEEGEANEYMSSDSVQAEKEQLWMFADRVANSKTEFSFGNALMKCRSDVKWNKKALVGKELIPKFDSKCIPEQADIAQQQEAQKALTEFVMASVDKTTDLDSREEQSKDVLEAVVSAGVGQDPIEIQLGEVEDTLNGNHTLNPSSEAALILKLGIAAYINGHGGDPKNMQDVQDAADALSVLSVPLGTILGFLQPVLDTR